MEPTLYLMMGLPGAGKTTAARIIENLTDATRLSSDEERLKLRPQPKFSEEEHQQLYAYLDSKTAELLKAGRSVIYDANLNRKVHRQEKYELATKYNATPVLLWVKAPRDTARIRRLEELSHHQFVPKSETPEAMFNRIADIFEAPANEEFIELDGTKITPEYIAEKLKLQTTT